MLFYFALFNYFTNKLLYFALGFDLFLLFKY